MVLLDTLKVRDAMQKNHDVIDVNCSLGKIATLFQNSSLVDFPVVDGGGQLYGIISLQEIRSVITEDSLYPLLIASEMTKPDPLFILAGSSFTEALSVFADGDASTLPVVDNSQDRKLIGVITH